MENAAMAIALVLIYGFNTLAAFFAAVLAVGGDGSASGVWFVGTIFAVVIASCLVGSIFLAGQKKFISSILCGIVALPLALGATFGISWLVISIKELAT